MNDRDIRRIFRDAAGDIEPDIDRIADAVPGMVAEARRRREQVGAMASMIPLARRAVPRLAAAAALLLVSATLVGILDTSETLNGSGDLDRLVLTGEVNGKSADILLEAIAQGGRDDG
jgi:hypothetical protein